MKEFLNRLDQFIEHEGVSLRSFEKEAEITNGTIRRAIKEGKAFNTDSLIKIADEYKNLNLEWLLRGEGEMTVRNINQNIEGNNNQTNIEGDNTQTNYNQVSKPPIEDKKEYTQENPIIEILRKELEEKNKLINGQREEIKDYKEIVKKKDDRIEKLTDKLISV